MAYYVSMFTGPLNSAKNFARNTKKSRDGARRDKKRQEDKIRRNKKEQEDTRKYRKNRDESAMGENLKEDAIIDK